MLIGANERTMSKRDRADFSRNLPILRPEGSEVRSSHRRLPLKLSEGEFEIDLDPAAVMLRSLPALPRAADRRHDMTYSMFKFALPLTLALAAVSGTAMAQDKTQSSQITIQGQPVQVTTVGRSYTGIPIVQYSFQRTVSYSNLDLSTSSGATELKSRVRQTAREACETLSAADPLDVPDDDGTCVRDATAGAMKQVTAAIAAANSGSTRATTVSAS